MSQLIVPRALRKLPKFDVFQNEGVTHQIQPLCRDGRSIHIWSNLQICPYTEMIPAEYLMVGYNNHTRSIDAIKNRVAAQGFTDQAGAKEVRKRLNGYLFINEIRKISIGYARMTDDSMIAQTFRGQHNMADTYRSGSVHYIVNPYSLYLRYGDDLTPCVILAIPRENYVYCKMHLMRTGFLDLSKCVMLIDQKLDTTEFPEQSFRNGVYKRVILPQIAQLNVTIAKVPVSYMLEKCFIQDVKLTSENIFERKKEEEELKAELIQIVSKHLNGGREPSPASEVEFEGEFGEFGDVGYEEENVIVGDNINIIPSNPNEWIISTTGTATTTVHPSDTGQYMYYTSTGATGIPNLEAWRDADDAQRAGGGSGILEQIVDGPIERIMDEGLLQEMRDYNPYREEDAVPRDSYGNSTGIVGEF